MMTSHVSPAESEGGSDQPLAPSASGTSLPVLHTHTPSPGSYSLPNAPSNTPRSLAHPPPLALHGRPDCSIPLFSLRPLPRKDSTRPRPAKIRTSRVCRLLWRCPCLILFLELLVFGGMSAGMIACHIEIDVGIDSFEIGADHSSVRQRNALAAAQREWGEKLDSAVAAQNVAGGHAPFRHLLWDDGAQRLSRHFSVWEEAASGASRSGTAAGGRAAGGGNRGLARLLSQGGAQPWGAGGGVLLSGRVHEYR